MSLSDVLFNHKPYIHVYILDVKKKNNDKSPELIKYDLHVVQWENVLWST